MQLDGISFFLPPITTILRILFPFFDLILILELGLKMIRRETLVLIPILSIWVVRFEESFRG